MKIVTRHNPDTVIVPVCGEPTNLYIGDTQLYTGDEVSLTLNVVSWVREKSIRKTTGVVVLRDGKVEIRTNKEYRIYHETKEGKLSVDNLELLRRYTEYKPGECVANGAIHKGFVVME